MSKYHIVKFDSEETTFNGELRLICIASVQKEGEEQPFRVQVENFDSPDDALKEVEQWIKAREEEDEAREIEVARNGELAEKRSVINTLNAQLEQ